MIIIGPAAADVQEGHSFCDNAYKPGGSIYYGYSAILSFARAAELAGPVSAFMKCDPAYDHLLADFLKRCSHGGISAMSLQVLRSSGMTRTQNVYSESQTRSSTVEEVIAPFSSCDLDAIFRTLEAEAKTSERRHQYCILAPLFYGDIGVEFVDELRDHLGLLCGGDYRMAVDAQGLIRKVDPSTREAVYSVSGLARVIMSHIDILKVGVGELAAFHAALGDDSDDHLPSVDVELQMRALLRFMRPSGAAMVICTAENGAYLSQYSPKSSEAHDGGDSVLDTTTTFSSYECGDYIGEARTGRGDTFLSLFVFCLENEMTPAESLATAATLVGRKLSHPGALTDEDVSAWLATKKSA